MNPGTVKFGNCEFSRMIIGGNPFSGFSHLGEDKDVEMMDYYTVSKIKETFRLAEEAGINTHIGRTDNHVIRCLNEYWKEGGKIQWIAQTASELPLDIGSDRAIQSGAKACFIHGGQMDFHLAKGILDQVPPIVEKIKKAGLPVGVAGHNPEVFFWAENNLNVDFYMCSYYNPTSRAENPAHLKGIPETFVDEDRDIMTKVIKDLSKPVIHYKVMAAGRKTPEEAWSFVAKHLRPNDAVCVGVYTKEKPDMIAENVRLLNQYLQEQS